MNEIFVPFFTTKPDGSGIGLRLSGQIIRLHGGNIYIETKDGDGTTVCMEFPREIDRF